MRAEPYDSGPTWHPMCWDLSMEQMTQKAQQILWMDRRDLEQGALTLGDPEVMAGDQQPINEQEMLVDPTNPPEGKGRAAQWQNSMQSLRAVMPYAGVTKPIDYDPHPGKVNPDAYFLNS